ncbi:hypothetical protein L1987_65971 [Smallanthus sonchifolius]|uniref:Uncharacterized protein n=1 Tax=Smallanthus sonchifolius TaxID=185202 RepID=A0ACB9BW75_9ASTR|nr:hypothetical protein L1987_65971 [Smallanthus sonchifolius]
MSLTFTLSFFFLLLLFASTTTTAQPYNATDQVFLDCGSLSSTPINDRRWDGDQTSKYVPSNFFTTSFSSKPDILDPSVPQTPYSSARIFNVSSFTYTFPVSQGPKFLRLYFYPATYSDLKPEQSFFTVSSNGYSLLTNFSAFLTASYLARVNGPDVPSFVKEFIIYVKDTQSLTVTFTPSPNSYAFINGIEIVSMPQNLYFNSKTPKSVHMTTGPVVTNDTTLENIYRLKMGGRSIPANEDTTGMYRSWEKDDSYIYGAATGLIPVYNKTITYTTETPNYTAPEEVYQNQRSMGKLSDSYNLTWILPVDSGFYYILRLHFCNIIPQYNKSGQVLFKIFINNQTADEEVDLFNLTPGPKDQAQNHVSTVVKGSIGYMDPEYYRSQQLTEKSDVYSFGVVLLEVLCARPAVILGLSKEQVSLAEWGKSCHQKGTMSKIIDPRLTSVIAPECLTQFGDVAVHCLKDHGSERPTMDEVVWGLEFALELQETADKTVGEFVSENQELPFLMQGETTTDDDVFTGSSSAMRYGTSSISSSDEGFKSDTVFSEILKTTGR